MRAITVSRKPLSESSVAANVLKHGTGALHIDACRIAAPGETVENHSRSAQAAVSKGIYGDSSAQETHQTTGQQLGRWPANMILQHPPGCRQVGVRQVQSNGHFPAAQKSNPGAHGKMGGGWTGDIAPERHLGVEAVEDWDCEPGCPVPDLDGQSGELRARGNVTPTKAGTSGMFWEDHGGSTTPTDGGDTGGASRFFKQVGGWVCEPDCPVADLDEQSIEGGIHGAGHARVHEHTGDYSASSYDLSGTRPMPRYGDMGGAARFFKQTSGGRMSVPDDLIEYLYTLITPTHVGGRSLVALDLSSVDWSEIEDASLHGLIAMSPPDGDPSPYIDNIWRVLKPGAHLLLIAPDEQPTGHTGACVAEDRGFEIRDAILLVQEEGHLHYVPKPSARERHAGCEHIKIQKAELREGSDKEVNADDPNLYKGNLHPTVKPKDLLVRLLADVPEGETILDPFMGSGSMALACLETGHSYIGIEKEEDYIEIADARIRHWDRAQAGWLGAEIESEAPSLEIKQEPISLDDFFDI